MDGVLTGLAARQGGAFLRRQALECGYSDDEIKRLLRARVWVRVRRGAYVEASLWDSLDPAGQHLMRVHAVTAVLTEPAVVSHVSAAIARGWPVWGSDLRRVHVTRPDLHSARIEGDVVHHAARLRDDEVELLPSGLLVTADARTVIDVARRDGFEPGVVTADAALHRGLSADHLKAALERQRDWAGSVVAGRVVGFADGRAESVGESRMRVAFAEAGLPAPELQLEFVDERGVVWARVDAAFEEERTLVEFDGKVKYKVPEGATKEEATEILWREKLRQDELSDLDWELTRVIWRDLSPRYRPQMIARVRSRFRRGRGGSAA